MTQAPRDRLETLEVKLAHLERTVQELGELVWRQQRQLEAADARHRQLLDRLAAADRGADASPEQFEVPPHY